MPEVVELVAAAAADDPAAPTAEATAEVVIDRRGSLNSLVIELKMERATPTPANSTAPEDRRTRHNLIQVKIMHGGFYRNRIFFKIGFSYIVHSDEFIRMMT